MTNTVTTPDGTKLYAPNARHQYSHAVIGKVRNRVDDEFWVVLHWTSQVEKALQQERKHSKFIGRGVDWDRTLILIEVRVATVDQILDPQLAYHEKLEANPKMKEIAKLLGRVEDIREKLVNDCDPRIGLIRFLADYGRGLGDALIILDGRNPIDLDVYIQKIAATRKDSDVK